MTIFYIGDDDVGSATALASPAGETVAAAGAGAAASPAAAPETVMKYTPDLRHATAEITLVAHSNQDRSLVGEKTPQELAAAFASMFTGKDKSQLKHFYFISCEAGMPSPGGGPSFAQKFAGEMKRLGFNALSIHAATPPVDLPAVGMRVEVITRSGASGQAPGHVTAFVYKNPYSERLDDLITKLSERIEFLKIEQKTRRLTDLESAELRRKQEDVTTLLRTRNTDPDYKKIDIFSGKNYKEMMDGNVYTFTETGPKSHAKDIAAFAIMQLEEAKRLLLSASADSVFGDLSEKEREKYLGYINRDIGNIKALPIEKQTITEIDKVLKGGRTAWQLFRSSYYNTIIKAITARLQEKAAERIMPVTDFTKVLPAVSASPPPPPPAATAAPAMREGATSAASTTRTTAGNLAAFRRTMLEGRTGGTTPSGPEERVQGNRRAMPAAAGDSPPASGLASLVKIEQRNALIERLTAYRRERQEEWSYHFNFLGIMSAVYYVLDALTGSNHFNSKNREVKLSAADELIDSLTTGKNAVLDEGETAALQDGRLGAIIAKYDGLEAVKALKPETPASRGIRPR